MAEDRGWAPLEPGPSAPGSGAGQSPPLPSGLSPSQGHGPAPGPGWAAPPPPAWAARPKAGNARTGPLPLHPMTLSDILDGAFNLFKANARSVLVIAAAFLVPVQLLSAFLRRDFLGGEGLFSVFNDPSTAESTLQSGGGNDAVGLLISVGATILVLPFVAGAISRVVAASYLGEEMTPGVALRAVGRRWWALVLAWLLVHVVEGIGFLLCILPGLLAMALFVAVAPAIAVEGRGPISGMKRSAHLIRPRVWPVLGIALLSGLLSSAVGGAIGFVPQMAAYAIGLKWGWILLGAGEILAGLVTTPLVAIVATLVYFDGRIRREGLDLQMMAADLAGSPSRPWA